MMLSGSYKLLKDFYKIKDLGQKEGEFSHQIQVARKLPADQAKKHKHLNNWYIKKMPDRNQAIIEVLAQEFFRLFYPSQPKTRLVIGDKGDAYVASKEIIGGVVINEAKQSYKGLGKIQVLSLVVNEIDLKPENIITNPNGINFKIDGNSCFWQLLCSLYNNPTTNNAFTSEDFAALPFLKHYPAYNWLNAIRENKSNPFFSIPPSLLRNFDYLNEVHDTTLSLLLFLKELINHFASYYAPEKLQGMLAKELYDRREMLYNAAISNPQFIAYMTKIDKDTFLKQYLSQLQNFTAIKKVKLFENIPDLYKKIELIFDYLQDTQSTINTIPTTPTIHISSEQSLKFIHVDISSIIGTKKLRAPRNSLDKYSLQDIHEMAKACDYEMEILLNQLGVARRTLYNYFKSVFGTRFSDMQNHPDTFKDLMGNKYEKTGAELKATHQNDNICVAKKAKIQGKLNSPSQHPALPILQNIEMYTGFASTATENISEHTPKNNVINEENLSSDLIPEIPYDFAPPNMAHRNQTTDININRGYFTSQNTVTLFHKKHKQQTSNSTQVIPNHLLKK